MSIRRIDARFLLAAPARRAVVLGPLEEWRTRLDEVGVEVVSDAPSSAADLVVAPADLAAEAVARSPQSVVLEGKSAVRTLRAAGYAVQRFLPLPEVEKPEVYLPLDQPTASRYAVEHWTVPTQRWKRLRNRVVQAGLSHSVFPPLRPVLTVGSRSAEPPYLIAAARELGVPLGASWLLTLGQIQAFSDFDSFYRGVFHVFRPEEQLPSWVLKFARLPGLEEDFDRDERGLELAQGAGGPVAERAPLLVGRFEVDGLQASLETAAVGLRLVSFLSSTVNRARKLQTIEEIAEWTIELGSRTAGSPAALEPERTRVAVDVIPRWTTSGSVGDLVEIVATAPSVLRHGDLWCWNVIVRDEEFTIVDWEDATRHSFPLWDLLYFLEDAFAEMDGGLGLDERQDHFVRLFRGELPTSAILFRWVREAAGALGLPPEAVGALATLCWLDHGLPDQAKEARRVAHGFQAHPSSLEAMARAWLADPALGPGWDRWRV